MSDGWEAGKNRQRGRCLIVLLLLTVVAGAVTALAWMLFLPNVVVTQIRERTGFATTVESLSCNAFTGRLTVRGLVIKNPAVFPTSEFLELRTFSAEADWWEIFFGRLVIDNLTLDVRRVTLVQGPGAKSNAEIFQTSLLGPASTRALPRSAANNAVLLQAPPFVIRRLSLRFDLLVIVDHSGEKPRVQEFPFGLDQRYENVTESRQLLVPDVLRRVAAENLGPVLARLMPGNFGEALGKATQDASLLGKDLLKDAGNKANDLFKGLRERLEESKKP